MSAIIRVVNSVTAWALLTGFCAGILVHVWLNDPHLTWAAYGLGVLVAAAFFSCVYRGGSTAVLRSDVQVLKNLERAAAQAAVRDGRPPARGMRE